VSAGASARLRLLLWADAWPAVYPADAVVERVAWNIPPTLVASRARGLGAVAIAALPPDGAPRTTALDRLRQLRKVTTLPIWLVGDGGGVAPSDAPDLTPWRRLTALEPRQVVAAMAAEGDPHAAAPAVESPPVEPLVTVFSPTGGAGASTVAAALARTLAGWRIATVVVDLNLHAPDQAVLLDADRVDPRARLEAYLRDPSTPPLALGRDRGLGLVPGLAELENLDDVRVGNVVALFEHLRPALRVVDTAPVVTDPAVYASLRSASHIVLVGDERVVSRIHLRRYRRLFLQLGLPWREALLVMNRPRPGPGGLSPAQVEEEVGLRPICLLPYRPGLAADGPLGRLDGSLRVGVETLAATIVGRRAPPRSRAMR
jgi:hypothetical protein